MKFAKLALVAALLAGVTAPFCQPQISAASTDATNNFIKNLRTCTPSSHSIPELLGIFKISIRGVEANKCQFDYVIPSPDKRSEDFTYIHCRLSQKTIALLIKHTKSFTSSPEFDRAMNQECSLPFLKP